METTSHKEDNIRRHAVFNLPAMNYLYKCVEKEYNMSFQELYLRFSEDDNEDIRYIAATSLHEAFKLVEDDEDTSILRGVLMGYILDPHKEVLMTMNKNLGIII